MTRARIVMALVICLLALGTPVQSQTGPVDCPAYMSPALGELGRDIKIVPGFDQEDRPYHCNAYVLDGYGAIHPIGAPPATEGEPYFSSDIAREVVLVFEPTEDTINGGYVLDGHGALHPFGTETEPPNPVTGTPYFGFDIARDVWLLDDSFPDPSGWVLDGRGALHPFGGAPTVTGTPYFSFDIAREIVMDPSETGPNGYILDGFGAMHPFGDKEPLSGLPYFPGNDIANDALLRGDGGYTLDGFGGVHSFGTSADPETTHPYTAGTDNYRAFDLFFEQGFVLRKDGNAFEWSVFAPA